MATEEAVAQRLLEAGERIVFVQPGGVMTAAIDPSTGRLFPIDEFGTGKGWLAVTSDRRVVYGYFGPFGGARFGSAFTFTGWREDPRGLALVNEGIGPEDVCIFIPRAIAPAALHGYMLQAFGPGVDPFTWPP